MKSAVLVLGTLLTALSFGQIKPSEEPIQHAFEAYRSHAGLQVTLDGTQQIGDNTKTFRTVAFWFQDIEDGRPMSKVDIVGYVDGNMTYRFVGDGVTAWTWDAVRNEYSASRYGNFSGAQPANYVNALFSSLKPLMRGQAGYPLRMLSESYSGEQARYTTWMPGTTVENTGDVVRYMLGDPVHRRLEFYYQYVAPATALTHVDYFDEVSFGTTSRVVNWTMKMESFDLALDEENFKFVPPAGARSVVGVRPVTGG